MAVLLSISSLSYVQFVIRTAGPALDLLLLLVHHAICPSKTYDDDDICKSCHSSCWTCDGALANNCLSCDKSQAVAPWFTQTANGQTCTSTCPAKFYKSDTSLKICLACHADCTVCVGPRSPEDCYQCLQNCAECVDDQTCTKCADDHYLFNELPSNFGTFRECLGTDEIIDGLFIEDTCSDGTGIVRHCRKNCQICESFNKCLQCKNRLAFPSWILDLK